jgi:hypothetical protein
MIRVHKGLIFALPILLATPAIAQISDRTKMRWEPGNGQSCKAGCSNKSLVAVESGFYSRNPPTPYFVCSVDAHQEGTRPGYQVEGVSPSRCTVGYGGKRETSSTYDCLCIGR